MKKTLFVAMLLLAGISPAAEPKGKWAIVLQAGAETNESKARAAHALLYACDLAEQGHEVVLLYDGAGTGWANEFGKPECPMHQQYLTVKKLGIGEEICGSCANSFDVAKHLSEEQRKLLVVDYNGHPSVAKWIGRGYRILVL